MSETSEIERTEKLKAKESLTPEQRVMSRTRGSILAPLERIDLPEEEIKTIQSYSEKVADKAREEYERLKNESPALKIIQAVEKIAEEFTGGESKRALEETLYWMKSGLANWQSDITEREGLSIVQGESKTRAEVVENLVKDRKKYKQKPRTIFSIGGRLSQTNEIVNRIMSELGYFPEGVNFDSFFLKLQKSEGQLNFEEIDKLNNQGKAVYVEDLKGRDTIAGLKSEKVPGVTAVLKQHRESKWVDFSFNNEAIVKSTSDIPAAVA